MEEQRECEHDGRGEATWDHSAREGCERSAQGENRASDEHNNLREDLREKTEELRSDLSEIARIAGEAIQQGIEALGKRGKDRLGMVESAIREEPIKGLMITAGVGVLVGFLLSRK